MPSSSTVANYWLCVKSLVISKQLRRLEMLWELQTSSSSNVSLIGWHRKYWSAFHFWLAFISCHGCCLAWFWWAVREYFPKKLFADDWLAQWSSLLGRGLNSFGWRLWWHLFLNRSYLAKLKQLVGWTSIFCRISILFVDCSTHATWGIDLLLKES